MHEESTLDPMSSPTISVRKWFTSCETTNHVFGKPCPEPSRRALAAAVINNPFASSYVEDLNPLIDAAPQLSTELAERCLATLGVPGEEVSAYGKGAIVGLNGELEHAAALIHPTFGAPVRAAIGGGAAIIPSTKVIASAGFRLTIPITNRNDIWSFDEMDSASISIDDAPHPDEIVIVLAYATGGRPAHRIVKRA
ncbi:MAG: hypothetical protein RJB08_899 [Actinomycetota bacterium]|jgi:hypothetical protein